MAVGDSSSNCRGCAVGRELEKERDTLKVALHQLKMDAMPDPYDERDIDLRWLKDRIFDAAKKCNV